MKKFAFKNKTKKTISLIGNSVEKDWLILVGILLISLVFSLIFSWLIYNSVTKDSVLTEEEYQQKSALKVNVKQLDQVLESYKSKQEKFNNLKGE